MLFFSFVFFLNLICRLLSSTWPFLFSLIYGVILSTYIPISIKWQGHVEFRGMVLTWLAVVSEYGVEFMPAAGVCVDKLNADTKVCLSTDLTGWAVQSTKKAQQLCHWHDFTAFLKISFKYAFVTWSCSYINCRAFCQLCNEQHFCLLWWNRLGAGWPWIARLTGKGYFPGPGRVILAYLMLVKRVKPTLLMMPHFLRRREQERLKTYPLLLNYSIFKRSMKEDTCLILWEFYQGHPHNSYSFLDRQWHHYFCMCWPPGLLSWNVTKLMIKQACTLK